MPLHANPGAETVLAAARPSRAPLAFHRALPGYAPTPLRALPRLAARCRVGGVWLKDESARLGLPAFKILGASWAVCALLAERLGLSTLGGDLPELARRLAGEPMLVAATDGEYGRAVARTAALLALPARIFLPAGAAPARVAAIQSEGASVTVLDGSYDEAVAAAAATARREGALLVQDTGWSGYLEVPDRIAEGYATLFWEIDEQLAAAGARAPSLAVVQVGVGALAQAAVVHWKAASRAAAPRLLGVEPWDAACVLAALRAGEIVTLPGRQRSLMAGLNCGTASATAWPWLRRGLDGVVTVDDEGARAAVRALADEGVVAGETGAAGAAALIALGDDEAARAALGLDARSEVLLLSTEGATDPASWRAIVGREPPALDSGRSGDADTPA